jgi:hypothetical protein
MSQINLEESKALAQAWKNRAQALGYKKGSRTHSKMEAEFFIGAIATRQTFGRAHPPVWELLIQCGRSISETYLPDEKSTARPNTEGKE